jgi:TatD DNase family protein
MTGLIDSHCHLDAEQFNEDRDAVIERAFAAGIEHIMAIGTGDGPPDLEAGIRLADRYSPIYCTVGVHPHDAAKANDGTLEELETLLRHPKVLAIGEMGLDYHYDFSPREKQRAVFIDQLAIARAAGKPIVIHTREAWDDTFAILEEHWAGSPHGGIMHCFSGGPDEAQRSLALGFHISFAGVVTFPKALALQAAAKEVPLDRVLIETDAPYLAPVPHRGKRNEPSYVAQTARKLAELRGMTLDEMASLTSSNFRRLCLNTQ